MTTFVPLGPRTSTAAADQTGQNKGNLTNSFAPKDLNLNVPFVEAYHVNITGVPAGAVATIKVRNQQWGFTAPGLAGSATAGAGTEAEYVAGVPLTPGDELDFFWSVASNTTPVPVVTIWLRCDIDIPANAAAIRA